MGKFFFGSSHLKQNVPVVESLALLRGISLAAEKTQSVTVEGDAKVLINMISGHVQAPWKTRIIIQDCTRICQQHLIPVAFVTRSCNQLANVVDRHALLAKEESSFDVKELPNHIAQILLAESAS